MRESVLLLVRAVIHVYVRPAMLSNSTYAKNILGKLSGNIIESSVHVSGGCAVVVSDESDVTMTEITTAEVEAVVPGAGEGGGEQYRVSALCVGGAIDGCTRSTEHREGLISHVVMSLVFLQARCPGEADIVPEAAVRYHYCHFCYFCLNLQSIMSLVNIDEFNKSAYKPISLCKILHSSTEFHL